MHLGHAGVSTLIAAPHFRGSDYLAKLLRALAPELATARPGQLRAKKIPDLKRVIQLGPDPRHRVQCLLMK